jgi:putative flippase GtrA
MIHPYYKAPTLLSLYRSGEIKVMVMYLVTGAITSLTDYTLFFICFNLLYTDLLIATIVAYCGGLFVSYVQSRYIVFHKTAQGEKFTTSARRYLILLAVNLGITYGMLWAMETWFGLTPLIGKFVVWTFLIFWNFIMNKYWVFKGPRTIAKDPFIWQR